MKVRQKWEPMVESLDANCEKGNFPNMNLKITYKQTWARISVQAVNCLNKVCRGIFLGHAFTTLFGWTFLLPRTHEKWGEEWQCDFMGMTKWFGKGLKFLWDGTGKSLQITDNNKKHVIPMAPVIQRSWCWVVGSKVGVGRINSFEILTVLTCKEMLQVFSSKTHGQGTAYLISRIRCNNIHIRILLHLILEILRYMVLVSWSSSNFFQHTLPHKFCEESCIILWTIYLSWTLFKITPPPSLILHKLPHKTTVSFTSDGLQWRHVISLEIPEGTPRKCQSIMPSVQTHRTAGFILKRVGHVHFDHYWLPQVEFLTSPPPWYHHHGISHQSWAGGPWKVQQCHHHTAPHWGQAAALCQERLGIVKGFTNPRGLG